VKCISSAGNISDNPGNPFPVLLYFVHLVFGAGGFSDNFARAIFPSFQILRRSDNCL
jgi:hypothetical protein